MKSYSFIDCYMIQSSCKNYSQRREIMRKYFMMFMLLMFGAVLVAADDNDDREVPVFDGEVGTEPLDGVTILTGGTAGVYYPLGIALADVIDTNTDANASGVASGASVTNVDELAMGEAQLALVQNDIAFYGFEGTNMFDQELQEFSGLFTMYPETIQVVVMEDSGIETIGDLEGMRVAVGDAGSGTEANAVQILEVHGLTLEDISPQYLSFADASTNLQDGNIDAAFITAGTPTGAVQELSAQQDIKILSFEEDALADLLDEYSYYTEVQLDEDTYENFDATATTVAVQAMVIASNELSEDQVYDIMDAIFNNLDVVANSHIRGEELNIETALDGMSVPLHPGAAKFYEDNPVEDSEDDADDEEDTEEDEDADAEDEEVEEDTEEDEEDAE